MTSLEDRKAILESVAEARDKGARLTAICDVIGVDARTLRRWSTADALAEGDRRPTAERPAPASRLTETERETILEIANREKYASLPPTRIVPMLADEGIYVASESSFYRVLKEAGQLTHRGASKAPVKQRPPTTHVARAPNELWAWDMTYRAPSTGKHQEGVDWAKHVWNTERGNKGLVDLMSPRGHARGGAEAAVTCCTLAG